MARKVEGAQDFKKTLILVAIAVVILVGGVYFVQTGGYQPAQTSEQQKTSQPTVTETSAGVKEITIHGKSFDFDSNTITVNKGDRVKITFISDDVSHDICVEGYGCSEVISKGQTTTLEFVAKESDKLKFFCSVDGHRQFGMEGDLVIQ